MKTMPERKCSDLVGETFYITYINTVFTILGSSARGNLRDFAGPSFKAKMFCSCTENNESALVIRVSITRNRPHRNEPGNTNCKKGFSCIVLGIGMHYNMNISPQNMGIHHTILLTSLDERSAFLNAMILKEY